MAHRGQKAANLACLLGAILATGCMRPEKEEEGGSLSLGPDAKKEEVVGLDTWSLGHYKNGLYLKQNV